MTSPTPLPKERTVFRRSAGPAPYTLEKHTEPLPTPLPPTSILIKVHAVSLNYRDANMLTGNNPWPILEQGIVGSDAAGEVLATGSHVYRFGVGDHVCPILDQASITGDEQGRVWLSADVDGMLATYLILDEQVCVKVPHHLTWAEAACLPNAGVTAWSSLISAETRKLTAGQTILLQGTGGVSMMALKFALASGNKVFITSSSDEKLRNLLHAFPNSRIETINYRTTPAWEAEVHRLNKGKGVDIILENGGTSSTLQSLRAVKKGGIISQVGYLGHQKTSHLDGLIPLLIDKAVLFRGINCGPRREFEEMNKLVEASGMRFEDVIDRRFKFEETEEAFKYLWEGKHVGKVVIEI